MRALGDSTPRRLPGTKWTTPSTQPVGVPVRTQLLAAEAHIVLAPLPYVILPADPAGLPPWGAAAAVPEASSVTKR